MWSSDSMLLKILICVGGQESRREAEGESLVVEVGMVTDEVCGPMKVCLWCSRGNGDIDME